MIIIDWIFVLYYCCSLLFFCVTQNVHTRQIFNTVFSSSFPLFRDFFFKIWRGKETWPHYKPFCCCNEWSALMFLKKSTTLSPFYLLSVWYSASRVKINWSNNHLTVESELVSGSYRLFLLYRYSCHRVLKKRSSFLSPPRYDYYSFYLSICSFFFKTNLRLKTIWLSCIPLSFHSLYTSST